MSRGYIGNLLQAEDPLTSSGVLDANERYVQLVTPKTQSVATRNILNGVLNCAWDKTSAVPKLLEIANTSEVKFNIDADNPLVLAFANGWDDLDRPAQIVKQLRVAPPNINLSAKANCHVQIVAKVINDELVITTHDIFDPGWSTWTNIIPTFTSSSPTDGWSVQASSGTDAYKLFDNDPGTGLYFSSGVGWVEITSPMPISLAGIVTRASSIWGFDATAKKTPDADWVTLGPFSTAGGVSTSFFSSAASCDTYTIFHFPIQVGKYLFELGFYERPIVKFFRSLNKVKDRSDVEQLWINLGYATVDASGNITALNHYTDLRNNYPGGMRVEA